MAEAWSPEARAAALASRKAHHGGKWGKALRGHGIGSGEGPGRLEQRIGQRFERQKTTHLPNVRAVYKHVEEADDDIDKTPGPNGHARMKTPHGDLHTTIRGKNIVTKLPDGDEVATVGHIGGHAKAVTERLKAKNRALPKHERARNPKQAARLRTESYMWADIVGAGRHPGDHLLAAALDIAHDVMGSAEFREAFEQHTLLEWSPEARAAALASRKAHHGGKWGKNLDAPGSAKPAAARKPGKVRMDGMLRRQITAMGGKGTAVGIARALGLPPGDVQEHLQALPAFENRNGIWRVKAPSKPKGPAPEPVPDYWGHIAQLAHQAAANRARQPVRAAHA